MEYWRKHGNYIGKYFWSCGERTIWRTILLAWSPVSDYMCNTNDEAMRTSFVRVGIPNEVLLPGRIFFFDLHSNHSPKTETSFTHKAYHYWTMPHCQCRCETIATPELDLPNDNLYISCQMFPISHRISAAPAIAVGIHFLLLKSPHLHHQLFSWSTIFLGINHW